MLQNISKVKDDLEVIYIIPWIIQININSMLKSWNCLYKHKRAGGGGYEQNPILGLNQIRSINPMYLFIFEEACALPGSFSCVEP